MSEQLQRLLCRRLQSWQCTKCAVQSHGVSTTKRSVLDDDYDDCDNKRRRRQQQQQEDAQESGTVNTHARGNASRLKRPSSDERFVFSTTLPILLFVNACGMTKQPKFWMRFQATSVHWSSGTGNNLAWGPNSRWPPQHKITTCDYEYNFLV